MLVHELLLLVRGELDHAELRIAVNGGEDAAADAKVGMAHMRVFDRAAHAQCDAPEAVCRHGRCANAI